ncbi:MAG: hypothetical protein M0Z84_03735, partial [Gammaproteobacteria bacterium]|nr:hypothetical protein [Gammaproteobacteria bacterium]
TTLNPSMCYVFHNLKTVASTLLTRDITRSLRHIHQSVGYYEPCQFTIPDAAMRHNTSTTMTYIHRIKPVNHPNRGYPDHGVILDRAVDRLH